MRSKRSNPKLADGPGTRPVAQSASWYEQFLTALKTVCPHDAGLITNLRRNSMFTANEIILVQASFARLVPMQDAAADHFYGRLFTIVPKFARTVSV